MKAPGRRGFVIPRGLVTLGPLEGQFEDYAGAMSRSDSTEWHREYVQYWKQWGLPRGTGRHLRRQWNKRQRQASRGALMRETEPEPTRTRHSVLYDYW